jgi:hypothetical protein
MANAPNKSNDIGMVLFLGGVGTAFFLLFTDIGRNILDNFGILSTVEGLPTIGDLVGENPYQFYQIPYPSAEGVPDYIKNPNPYLLQGQPYTYIGGDIPYVHPAAAREIMEDQPSGIYREPDPLTVWLDKLFHGENK